ncbi:MAG: T9SS type A sorting domain-containing protein [Bacteroidia bacterium]|jgi:hypothetical protein|nr:T9SS type A sorting domain-containing protein [Bacteroidia bacterium]
MKKTLHSILLSLLLLTVCASRSLHAQPISFSWVKEAFASQAGIHPVKTITDNQGNIYVTGYFGNRVFIGTDTLDAVNPPFANIFLAKYDSSGNYLWAKSYGGADTDYSYGLAVDDAGNVYISGITYDAQITFDAFTLTNQPGSFSMGFWAKFNSSGQCQLAKAMWCKQNQFGLAANTVNDITVDAQGMIYVTGGFETDTICFDNECLAIQKPIGFGGGNIFAAKFDAAGNCLWLSGSGPGTEGGFGDAGKSITLDENGDLYISGKIGSIKQVLGNETLYVANGEEGFCARLSSTTGNFMWAKAIRGFHFGEFTFDMANGILSDRSGHIYVGGYYQGFSVVYDSTYTVSSPQNPQNPDSVKIFLFKLNASNGNVLWGKGYGNTAHGIAVGTDWAISPDMQRIAMAGFYGGLACTFDALSAPAINGINGIVLEFDTIGTVLRGTPVISTTQDEFTSVAYDFTGKLIAAGKYSGTPSQLGNQFTLQNPFQNDFFYDLFLCRQGVPLPASVNDPAITEPVVIWPNPVNNQLNIMLPHPGEEVMIRIYDMTGRLILSESHAGGILQITVNTESLTGGKYLLSVVSGTYSATVPFVQAAK